MWPVTLVLISALFAWLVLPLPLAIAVGRAFREGEGTPTL